MFCGCSARAPTGSTSFTKKKAKKSKERRTQARNNDISLQLYRDSSIKKSLSKKLTNLNQTCWVLGEGHKAARKHILSLQHPSWHSAMAWWLVNTLFTPLIHDGPQAHVIMPARVPHVTAVLYLGPTPDTGHGQGKPSLLLQASTLRPEHKASSANQRTCSRVSVGLSIPAS